MLTEQQRQTILELQERIRERLPDCCKDCTYIDGAGICSCGGCGCEED